jgi:hypothetical protein
VFYTKISQSELILIRIILILFENRVLRRIFGPKREKVGEDWSKLSKKEFHNSYSSPNIVRVTKSRIIRWAEHVVSMGVSINAYRILVGKSKKRPLVRPRRRWDLRKIGCEGVDWIRLAQVRDP